MSTIEQLFSMAAAGSSDALLMLVLLTLAGAFVPLVIVGVIVGGILNYYVMRDLLGLE